jgi:hypothetical protein
MVSDSKFGKILGGFGEFRLHFPCARPMLFFLALPRDVTIA